MGVQSKKKRDEEIQIRFFAIGNKQVHIVDFIFW